MATSEDEDYEYEYSDDDDYPVSDDDEMECDNYGENPNAAPMKWSKSASTVHGKWKNDFIPTLLFFFGQKNDVS